VADALPVVAWLPVVEPLDAGGFESLHAATTINGVRTISAARRNDIGNPLR
jgi:hypothetical protein